MKLHGAWVAVLTVCACVPSRAPEGGEGQRCYPNGTCDGDLRCLSDRCVRVPWDAGPDVGPDVPGDTTGDTADPGGPDSKDHQADLDKGGTDETGAPEDAGDPGSDLRDEGLAEDLSGQDACTPDCQGRECGNDGCGGSCGSCGEERICTDAGRCEAPPWTCRQGMCRVPAGPFWMGSNRDNSQCPTNQLDPDAAGSELPCHLVTVPEFWMDRLETTVAEYREFVEGTGPNCGARWQTPSCVPQAQSPCNWGAEGRENHPVNCLEHFGADLYCKWRGKRLCTEAEWEKAARGTDGRIHSWGNTAPDCEHAHIALNAQPWGSQNWGCGTGLTAAVGTYPGDIGPYGILDLAGNVAELVEDEFASNYRDVPVDGSAWHDPRFNLPNVARGGVFTETYTRAAMRGTGGLYPAVGFRCCSSSAPE